MAEPKLRVLVVDDSVVMRRLISRVIDESGDIEVVGAAATGRIALQRIPQVNPDVLTLDIEMPDMNGLETVRAVRSQFPRVRVIMLSSLTHKGASATLDALSAGASDYLTKPTGQAGAERSLDVLRNQLLPKIRQFGKPAATGMRAAAGSPATVHAAASAPALPHRRVAAVKQVVAVGTSTGGPVALQEFLRRLPRSYQAGMVVVQHMPPVFTRLLAQRLAAETGRNVMEATDGLTVEAGRILLAPGDFHMTVQRQGDQVVVRLNQDSPENSCRPAVDPLFRSVAAVYGPAAVGVILTGMGQDGRTGTERMRENGAWIIAQDAATSVVWGMPGAVVEAGLADRVLPLDEIAPEVARHFAIAPGTDQRRAAHASGITA